MKSVFRSTSVSDTFITGDIVSKRINFQREITDSVVYNAGDDLVKRIVNFLRDLFDFFNSIDLGSSPSGATTSTTITTISPGGGGGSGSGGGVTVTTLPKEEIVLPYVISPYKIEERLERNETKLIVLNVKNNKNVSIDLFLEITGAVIEFATLDSKEIKVSANSSKDFLIQFTVPSLTNPDVYSGDLVVTDGIKTIVPLTLIVVSHVDKLLDISAEIITKEIKSTDNLIFNVKIFNLGRLPKYDISLTYTVSNENTNEIIYQQTETMAVETSLDFPKTIQIPEETAPGKYMLQVVATYDNETAIAKDQFTIIKTEETRLSLYLILFLIILTVLIASILYRKKKKNRNKHQYLLKDLMELKRSIEEPIHHRIKKLKTHRKTQKKHIKRKRKRK